MTQSTEVRGKANSKKSDELDENLDKDSRLYVLPEADLDEILRGLEDLKPQVAVIDSIQNLYYSALSSAPSSFAQVRECTSILM